MNKYALVGDIGGTNARFALVEKGQVELQQIEVFRCADYVNFDDACRHYYEKLNIEPLDTASISFACPVAEKQIKMTNNHWAFNRDAMQKKLVLKRFDLVNDFTAMAYGMLYIKDEEKLVVQRGDGARFADTPRLVIGPGTGLGVSGLIPFKNAGQSGSQHWLALAAEGGHVSFAPHNEYEIQILQRLQQRYGRVSVERILSGDGLVALYQAIVDIEGQPAVFNSAAQITAGGLAGDNPYARQTLSLFCQILGATAGDMVLTQGARGGVYLCGGILPRIKPFFLQSDFLARFAAKGRFSDYLSNVPVWLCDAEYPGLLGAAVALKLSTDVNK